MGNYAVNPDKWQDYPNGEWSLGADIDFSSKSLSWRIITYENRYEKGADSILVEESRNDENINHKHHLEICNRPLYDSNYLTALWHEVAIRAYYHYGAKYMGHFNFTSRQQRIETKKWLSSLKSILLNRTDPYLVGWFYMSVIKTRYCKFMVLFFIGTLVLTFLLNCVS